ncbi:RNA polymerase sigma factor [Dyella telluris]|uniref:Sigma-70 family RNA polymerase sigma factor n=1 Tax=Dyella telluris TaxID=2763498 RepID=A0A7G8Q844_9GAMM|nr:sigma-70 family RNA polymerase sigma factor [Dyella telluris]QNK02952.1 sigma-70 family RNA polymerase sigma factor [Dyella telluris]
MDIPLNTPSDPGVNLDPAFALRIADLFRDHNRALVAFLQCRLHSLSDAQEVAQEAYVRLVTMERPEQVDSLRAYLFRVASNLAVDRLRSRQVRADHPLNAPDEDLHLAPIPERHVHATGQLHALHKALRELPAKTGRAFVMHVIDGCEISVIARAMKISERMVRYHVANALAHCRARVDEPEMP